MVVVGLHNDVLVNDHANQPLQNMRKCSWTGKNRKRRSLLIRKKRQALVGLALGEGLQLIEDLSIEARLRKANKVN